MTMFFSYAGDFDSGPIEPEVHLTCLRTTSFKQKNSSVGLIGRASGKGMLAVVSSILSQIILDLA